MITQSQPSSDMTYYDPLASHFMSGGQMGYMPNAQFLTDPNYGAFRTMPGPAMTPTTMHTPTTLQSWLTANRGTPFGHLPAYTFNTYNPAADQMNYLTQAHRRTADQFGAIGSSVFDMGLSTAVGMGVGLFSPMAGLAVGLGMPTVGRHFVDRVRNARQIQNMSMSKIVGGSDMSATLNQGFSGAASTRMGEHLRTMASENLVFNNEDMQNIMKLGVEHGQFDYSLNVNQYKTTMKNLVKNVRAIMEIAGTSDMKEIFSNMQRLQTMGAGLTDMSGIMHKESMFARMTGLSQSDMVNTYGQQGALMFSQAGLTNYQGSLMNMSNAATVTMMQRMGLLDPGELARAGGISGMTQRFTANKANLIQQNTDYFLPFLANKNFSGINADAAFDMVNGQYSISDSMMGANRLNSPTAKSRYNAWRSKGQQQLQDIVGETGMDVLLFRRAMEMGRNLGIEDPREAALAGFQLQNVPAEEARQIVDSMTDPEIMQAKMSQLKNQRHRAILNDREEAAFNRGLTNRAELWFKKTTQRYMASTYGRATTWWNDRQDAKEEERLGITSVRKGATSGIGYNSFDEEVMAKAVERNQGFEKYTAEDKHDAVGFWKNMRYGGRYGSYIEFTDELIRSRDMGDDDLSSGMDQLRKLGINISILGDKIAYRLKDKKHVTEDDVLNLVTATLSDGGTDPGKARKIAESILKFPSTRQAILNKIATSKRTGYTMQSAEAAVGEYHKNLHGLKFKKATELRKEFQGIVGEMVNQRLGFIDEATDRDELLGAMQSSVGATAANMFLGAASRIYEDPKTSKKKKAHIDSLARGIASKFGLDGVKNIYDLREQVNKKYEGKLSDDQIASIEKVMSNAEWDMGDLDSFRKAGLGRLMRKGENFAAMEKIYGDANDMNPTNLTASTSDTSTGIGGKNEESIKLMQKQFEVLSNLDVSIKELTDQMKTRNRGAVKLLNDWNMLK